MQTNETRQAAEAVRAGCRFRLTRRTVIENIMIGAFLRHPRVADARAVALRVARLVGLDEVKETEARNLPIGGLKRLEVARTLATEPAILLFDEPSLGLAPIIVQQMFGVIDRICAMGTTVLLVEQKAFHALKIAHRAYVIENGHIAMRDTGPGLLANPHVKTAYLGI